METLADADRIIAALLSPTRLEGMETQRRRTHSVATGGLRPALRGWKLVGDDEVFGVRVVSPTRLEGMETILDGGVTYIHATSPTRLEGMETALGGNGMS
jgi:hypothetical protein